MVSNKPRKRKPVAEQTIFEQLSQQASTMGQEYEPTNTSSGVEAVENKAPSSDELLKQIAALNEQISNLRQPLPMQAEPTAPQAPGALSFADLPDPTTDPEAYGRALNDRITAHTKAQNDYADWQGKQAKSASNKQAALWEDFAIQYPEISGDKVKAEFAAQTVARAAHARGIDVERYMYTHSTRFLADVAKVYEQTFGKPVNDDEDEEDDNARPASRTAGIFGGEQSGGKPAGRGSQVEQPGDMIKELHETQRKLGLF